MTNQPQDNEAQVFVASQWQLMWWRFRKHKLALVCAYITIFIYIIAIFPDFFAPFPPDRTATDYTFAPPQRVKFFQEVDGERVFNLHVNDYKVEVDPVALRRNFVIDSENVIDIGFLVEGEPYKVLGIWEATTRLIGPKDNTRPMYLFGADKLGRDLFSGIIYGTQISMSIGLLGVLISLILGIILGGLSGFYGGAPDNVIQRIIEFLRSIPSIPLWMGLAAAMPTDWPPVYRYFAITVILSIIGWTGLARVVRGKFLSLREEDFVMAAKLDGASQMSIILKYMLPSFLSHIIASITLAIPGMILSETSLSFLGLGLRRPVISWGVLLFDAQNVRAVVTAPWLLLAALPVIISVLVLNFLGDGLRDAADPYSR
ncbi:MAG: ABC transporter permease [Chloroflexota bacterium]